MIICRRGFATAVLIRVGWVRKRQAVKWSRKEKSMTAAVTGADAAERFAGLSEKEPLGEYNYEHFRTRHLLQDARRTIQKQGILPGEIAPDFELPRAGSGSLRLSELRGKPVLVHFGSFT
jgi:hypothetical protein